MLLAIQMPSRPTDTTWLMRTEGDHSNECTVTTEPPQFLGVYTRHLAFILLPLHALPIAQSTAMRCILPDLALDCYPAPVVSSNPCSELQHVNNLMHALGQAVLRPLLTTNHCGSVATLQRRLLPSFLIAKTSESRGCECADGLPA